MRGALSKSNFTCLVVLLVFTVIMGCAATRVSTDRHQETWAGEMTGMVTGRLKLFTWQTVEKDNIKTVESRLNLIIESTAGGYGGGVMKGQLKGTIKNGRIDAVISGYATVADGSSDVRGRLTGILTESEGSGSWQITASVDSFSFNGKWTITKQ